MINKQDLINQLADVLVEYWENSRNFSKESQDKIIQIMQETSSELKSESLANLINEYVEALEQQRLAESKKTE